MQHGRKARIAAIALAAWLAGAVAGTAADEARPSVGLDDLLKLPSSLDLEPASRGRLTKAEWRTRFDEARAELEAARAALAATQEKIATAAGDSPSWQVAAPGIGGAPPGPPPEGPVDFSLSAEMRRNREEVEHAERRLSELEIEANLASVPEDWRGTPPEADEPSPQPAEAVGSAPIQ